MGYLLWSRSNPGVGNTADIRAAASMRVSDAETARTSAAGLTTGSEGLAGSTADALASRVEMIRAETLAIAAQHDADAGALSRYATELERIQASQRAIEAEEDTVTAATHRLAGEATALRSQRRSWAEQDRDDKVWQLDHQLTVNSQQNAFATTQMQGLSRRMDALAEERRIADAACVAALSGVDARGGLGSAPGTPGILVAGVTLSGLSQMSSLDILTLLQARPDALDELSAAAPEDAAEWWSGLTLDQQSALVVAAPGIIGALNGIPVMARVGANRLVARDQLQKDRAYLANWEGKRAGEGGPDSNPGFWEGQDQRIAEVEARVRYLERVINPDASGTYVQLVLLDVEGRRIAEMIGTPGPDTRVTLTHVPGTYTTMRSFYDGDVQQLPAELVRASDDRVVAFVWKGERFPGEFDDPSSPGGMFNGIAVEANSQSFGDRAAPALAQFHDGMKLTPQFGDVAHDASAHSWGLNALTTAETQGPSLRNVYSLAGAYVPEIWNAPAENYYAAYYAGDMLSEIQEVIVAPPRMPYEPRTEDTIMGGLVGGGRAPQYQNEFQPLVGDGFSVPHDTEMSGVELHNLIASSDVDENEQVIRNILDRMVQ